MRNETKARTGEMKPDGIGCQFLSAKKITCLRRSQINPAMLPALFSLLVPWFRSATSMLNHSEAIRITPKANKVMTLTMMVTMRSDDSEMIKASFPRWRQPNQGTRRRQKARNSFEDVEVFPRSSAALPSTRKVLRRQSATDFKQVVRNPAAWSS